MTRQLCHGAVMALLFTPDDKMIAYGDSKGVIHFRETATGKPGFDIRGGRNGHFGYITALSMTRDARYLVSGSSHGTLLVWDLKTKYK